MDELPWKVPVLSDLPEVANEEERCNGLVLVLSYRMEFRMHVPSARYG